MVELTLGLFIFVVTHSLRVVAPAWRQRQLDNFGALGFKVAVAILSLVSLWFMVQGYGTARLEPVVLWQPAVAMRHVAALLMLVAMVLLVAAYAPRNGIRARLKHPMVLTVKVWAIAHLLANGTLADALLFGTLLVWAVFNFRAARRREVAFADSSGVATLVTVVVGVGLWAGFVMQWHVWLFGVSPMGM